MCVCMFVFIFVCACVRVRVCEREIVSVCVYCVRKSHIDIHIYRYIDRLLNGEIDR